MDKPKRANGKKHHHIKVEWPCNTRQRPLVSPQFFFKETAPAKTRKTSHSRRYDRIRVRQTSDQVSPPERSSNACQNALRLPPVSWVWHVIGFIVTMKPMTYHNARFSRYCCDTATFVRKKNCIYLTVKENQLRVAIIKSPLIISDFYYERAHRANVNLGYRSSEAACNVWYVQHGFQYILRYFEGESGYIAKLRKPGMCIFKCTFRLQVHSH